MKIIKKHYKLFHSLIILLTIGINLSFFINYSQALTKLSYIRDWGGHVEVFGPAGADAVQVAVGQNNELYLSDTRNHRVLVYDIDGNKQFEFGSEGTGQGQFKYPWGIAVSPVSNNIYVADSSNNRIQYFDSSGVFVGSFGSFGSSNGQLKAPRGVAVDNAGDVYVVDYLNQRIQIFSENGQFKSTFGTAGAGNGQFRYPSDVTIVSNGNIYVSDTENNRIQIFKSTGSHFSNLGTYGAGANQFNSPKGLAFSPQGSVFAVDSGNKRIAKIETNGTMVNNFGSTGNINSIGFIDVQDLAVAPNGHVFIADAGNRYIYVLAGDGSIVNSFEYDTINKDGKFNYPNDVYYSPVTEKVYVADTYNYRIQIFDKNGNFISKFGEYGTSNGQFQYPSSVVVDPTGRIFVTDKQNYNVQVFSDTGTYLFKFNDPLPSTVANFTWPTGLSFYDNKIYIADTGNDRILIYDTNGNYLNELGVFGDLDGEFMGPMDVAVDGDGDIYVADTGNERIQKFSNNLQFVMKFGSVGTGNGNFNQPQGIIVNNSGQIFVSDTNNYRIQFFDENGNYISKYDGDLSVLGKYKTSIGISNGPNNSIYVADVNNNKVFQFGEEKANTQSTGGTAGTITTQPTVVPPIVIPPIIPPTVPPTIPPVVSPVDTNQVPQNQNSFIPESVRNTVTVVRETINNVITEPIRGVVTQLEEVTPEPLQVYAPKTFMTSGLLFGSVAMVTDNLFATPMTFHQLMLFPARLWANLLTLLGIKRRRRPWGAVYDTLTKIPIDPVVMELVNKDGYVTARTKTDIYGRYYFNAEPGHYMLRPKKDGYVFPSLILAHMTRDEIYKDIYFGNYFEIKYQNEMISKNIPMDRTKISSEEIKNEDQKILNWFAHRDHIISAFTNLFFVVGFAVSALALLLAPRPYNVLIFVLYVFMYLLRKAGANPSKLGKVLEGKTKAPLAFAIVRVYSVKLGNEVVRKVTNKFGQFFCSVPDGEYYLSFDRRNSNGSYTEASKKELVEVKKGAISGRWEAVF